MNVLVTGASGFIGRYLLAELSRRGHRLTALVRDYSELTVPPTVHVERVPGDLRVAVPELGTVLDRAHAIVHLVGGSGQTWRSTFDINVIATENLLNAISTAGWRGRFVHVSTLAVYDFNRLAPGSEIAETSLVEPRPERRDVYAWTKLIQERTMMNAAADRFELTVVRPGAVYGAERRFQHRLGRQVGGTLAVFGGLNPMPLTYVENTASLLAECVVHPLAAGQVFNAIDTPPVRQWQYLRAWRRLAEQAPSIVPIPLTALRAAGRGLNLAGRLSGGRVSPPGIIDPYLLKPSFGRFAYRPSRAIELLGWRPPVDLDQALQRTFGADVGSALSSSSVRAGPPTARTAR